MGQLKFFYTDCFNPYLQWSLTHFSGHLLTLSTFVGNPEGHLKLKLPKPDLLFFPPLQLIHSLLASINMAQVAQKQIKIFKVTLATLLPLPTLLLIRSISKSHLFCHLCLWNLKEHFHFLSCFYHWSKPPTPLMNDPVTSSLSSWGHSTQYHKDMQPNPRMICSKSISSTCAPPAQLLPPSKAQVREISSTHKHIPTAGHHAATCSHGPRWTFSQVATSQCLYISF